MDMMTETLACDLAEELALPATPADELAQAESLHRGAVASYMDRAAAARRRGKAREAELEDERRRLVQIHQEEMTRLDGEVAASRAATVAEIAACDRLAAVSRAALEALTA